MALNIDKERQLFFGCKIDSKMREALGQASPSARHYFEDDNPDYLRICLVGEEKWIGKVLKSGMSCQDVEDIQRNVVSILRRISPEIRISASALKLFSVYEAEAAEPAPPPRDSGPYIA